MKEKHQIYRSEYKLRHSAVPTWLGLAAAALAFVLLRVPNIFIRSVVAVFVGIGVGYVASLFFAPRLVRHEVKYTVPQSGDAEVDRTIKDAHSTLEDIRRTCDRIRPIDAELALCVDSCVVTSYKILDHVAASPQKSKTLHRYFTYYLPMLDKLTKNFVLLESDGSAASTRASIKDAAVKLDATFVSIADKLMSDTILDIETDIEVLKTQIGDEK